MAGGKPFDRMKAIANDVSVALASAKPMTAQMSWNDFQHANANKGLSPAQMSDAYTHYKQTGALPGSTTTLATTSQPAPLQKPASSGHGGLNYLGIVVLAIVGIVFWRRRNRDSAPTSAVLFSARVEKGDQGTRRASR